MLKYRMYKQHNLRLGLIQNERLLFAIFLSVSSLNYAVFPSISFVLTLTPLFFLYSLFSSWLFHFSATCSLLKLSLSHSGPPLSRSHHMSPPLSFFLVSQILLFLTPSIHLFFLFALTELLSLSVSGFVMLLLLLQLNQVQVLMVF